MLCRILACLLAISPLATSQFTSPAAGAVLVAGDKVNVSYTTDLKNYTIALWQRAENGNRPKLGSIVYATTDGPSSSFTWTVQTYNLDLGASRTFFFWLFEGGASHQGNDLHQISSSYFNVTDKGATSSVSAAESASTAPAPSPTPASSPPEKDLSVGARAGIGAAVSVFCLIAMALVFLLFRHRSRERPGADGEALASSAGVRCPATDCTDSVAELQSDCVSPRATQKLPCRVYQPVPGDTSTRPPPLAELPA
ncbi:hypothetical protein J3458_005801 [Metarhizium acridum]|uniref:Yeast cell wall synthesis Kre9/Knh1-like N-terminal domain-containing protein n=1 Tax=Metarhizium acridum (strain CQMa 102) TaxID=655827 RepID=E9EAZ4_METAQ|nr:uncharacterized protein MAC_07042 [Metarhizium acridum CQMa 102]EFY86925.1 hypothetical protein MAC_07042 [Metarhizium acridum CQMa 102]KAG8418382.1 hypothetical protein J3458_005801 [Metarhizium acridum]